MKIAIYEKYGPPEVLKIKEVPKPTPKENEVLIKVIATTVSSADCRLRAMNMPFGFGLLGRLIFGIFGPKKQILGTELSGIIESVGDKVTKFCRDDEVFVFLGAKMGCYSEFVCVAENGMIVHKPKTLSFAQAASLSFGGTTALDFLKRSKIKDGDRVLIVGAAGCVGTAFVQIAKHFGAHVTGICSEKKADLVKSLGADVVIDYTQSDFTKNGEKYTIIADTVGSAPFSVCKNSLQTEGKLLLILASLPELIKIPFINLTSHRTVIGGPVAERLKDLQLLAQLAEAGMFTPAVDCMYPFSQIVEAHKYVDSGRKIGSVVLQFDTSR